MVLHWNASLATVVKVLMEKMGARLELRVNLARLGNLAPIRAVLSVDTANLVGTRLRMPQAV
jgi:hypothetical protein